MCIPKEQLYIRKTNMESIKVWIGKDTDSISISLLPLCIDEDGDVAVSDEGLQAAGVDLNDHEQVRDKVYSCQINMEITGYVKEPFGMQVKEIRTATLTFD